ncbi:hypothetical protein G6L37_05170 [Agrobacterium rubi]|nr:hypothetical protein [Agrobacterium rubi]NTF24747.1 hypothetical protein [Agrobacterium rubi]
MIHIDPPLPTVYAGRLLSLADTVELADNFEVSRYLADRAVEDLGGVPITTSSEGADELIARMMAAEAIFALNRTDMPTSGNWYTDAINRMINVAGLVHPEITSDEIAAVHPSGMFGRSQDARTVLLAAIAITSQNNAVFENMNYAIEQYREFCAVGRFSPKRYGANGAAVESNLSRFNSVLDKCRGDLGILHKVLTARLTMKELRSMAARHGIKVGGKEMADEIVHGSMIFGPKVGNGFLQNLLGNFEPVTIDLWFMRMWGRYTGTLVRDDVSGDAVSRLVRGIRRAHRSQRMVSLMQQSGVYRDPVDLWDLDNAQMLSYARDLKRFWEKLRRGYVSGHYGETFSERSPKAHLQPRDNATASEMKARLIWPGAVESLVKSLGSPVDAPSSAGLRRWIRSVCHRSLVMLKDSGYEMTAADLQALLWYPEKEIYGRLSGRPFERLNASYDEAMIRIAQREGFTSDDIAEAVQSVGAYGKGRSGNADGSGFGDTRTVVGFHRRADRLRGERYDDFAEDDGSVVAPRAATGM